MELPNINLKSTKHNAFGPLKFNNRFAGTAKSTLNSLQNDNLFFKQKLAEFELRLDNISSKERMPSASISRDSDKNSKFNKFSKLRERRSYKDSDKKNVDGLPACNVSRNQSLSSQLSARLDQSAIRSSLLSARTNNSSANKIDDILENLKKHRRSAVRRDVYESSTMNFKENSKIRPKTSANLPQVSNKENTEFKIPSHDPEAKKSAKKNRAKTARTEGELKKEEDDDDYCHMFYSRSWRIHPELGIIKDKDRTVYDNTQTNFYHTTKQPPETFIFAPDWI